MKTKTVRGVGKSNGENEICVDLASEFKITDKFYLDKANCASMLSKTFGVPWLPIGLQPSEIDEFILLSEGHKLPLSKSTFECLQKARFSRSLLLLPKQDLRKGLVLNDTSKITNSDVLTKKKTVFLANRDDDLCYGFIEHMDISEGKECQQCRLYIGFGDFCVRVKIGRAKGGGAISSSVWHPKCFKCAFCKVIHCDYLCWESHGLFMCLRHYGESKFPRCRFCEELIFDDNYVNDKDFFYHSDHFSCSRCSNVLIGSYVSCSNGEAFCEDCYNVDKAINCSLCAQKILANESTKNFKDELMHSRCFSCSVCERTIENGKLFGVQRREPNRLLGETCTISLFCNECYKETVLPSCLKCNKPIFPGQTVATCKDVHALTSTGFVHRECFFCCSCQSTLELAGDHSDICVYLSTRLKDTNTNENCGVKKTFERSFYCVACAENIEMEVCPSCFEVLKRDGVVRENGQIWHSSCLTCSSCKNEVCINKKLIKNADNSISCVDCANICAPKCRLCKEPITGFGSLSNLLVVFEGNSYHKSCCKCHICNSQLLEDGASFLSISEEKLLCLQCA